MTTSAPATALRRAVLPNGMNVAYQSKAELRQFYADIFEKRTYLQHGIELAPGATVFDVGANIGLFTVFVDHLYPGSRIFAFEPAPPLFAILEENTAWCGGEVLLFPCGLADRPGEAELTFYPHSSGMSSFHPDPGQEKAALRTLMRNERGADTAAPSGIDEVLRFEEELLEQRFASETWACPLRTLSEVVAEHGVERIDLLKVDVEKSEARVLAGIAEADWPRIRQLVVEVHDLDDRVARMAAELRGRGFAVTALQEELYRETDRWNLYALRRAAPCT
jgi:phthiocerol/phenolphthiocerol synthesis type-I polyketide synthase E